MGYRERGTNNCDLIMLIEIPSFYVTEYKFCLKMIEKMMQIAFITSFIKLRATNILFKSHETITEWRKTLVSVLLLLLTNYGSVLII